MRLKGFPLWEKEAVGMSSLFSIINMGRRALQVQQKSIEVTGHNISNANVEGYSRQSVIQSTVGPSMGPAIAGNLLGDERVGEGVQVEEIRRMGDEFVMAQIWKETRELGRWVARRDASEQLELIFNEPGSVGIRARLDEFWSALQDLNASPASRSARVEVRERAQALVDIVTHIYRQLIALQRDLDGQIRTKVDEINSLALEVAQLNREIDRVVAAGMEPNDLRDRRDLLVTRLARVSGASATQLPGQPFKVTLGGITLVSGVHAEGISLREEAGLVRKAYPVWGRINMDVKVESGELKGLMEMRDEVIEETISRLNEFAVTFTRAMNEVHRNGYSLEEPPTGGIDFFKEGITTAGDMALSDRVKNDTSAIAASLTGDPGNGDNAAEMAERILSGLFDGGTYTPRDFLTSIVTDLGVEVQGSSGNVERQEVLINHLKTRREAVAGISLDEEMANLVQFQHAYSAAARFISTIDEILDLIVNRMGVVGR